MADYYVKKLATSYFLQNRTWSVGDLMVGIPTDTSSNHLKGKGWVWECTTGGTSTGTPTWPASNPTPGTTTVTQNGVVWTARSSDSWTYPHPALAYLGNAFSNRLTASDRVFVSSDHVEDWTGHAQNMTISLVSTFTGARVPIFSVDDTSGAPPTVYEAGATLKQNQSSGGGQGILFKGAVHVKGFSCSVGKSGGATGYDDFEFQAMSSDGNGLLEDVSVELLNTGTSESSHVMLGTGTVTGVMNVRNLSLSFSKSTQYIQVGPALLWEGGSVGGPEPPATVFKNLTPGKGEYAHVRGVDFSGCASTVNLVDLATIQQGGRIRIVNPKLPTSWSGSLVTGTPPGTYGFWRVEMRYTESGIPKLWLETDNGQVKSQLTTLVKTGGASHDGGTTLQSWKIVTSANPSFPSRYLELETISIWNAATGSAKTISIDLLRDSASNLTDIDAWMEVSYLGTAGGMQESFASTKNTNPLASSGTNLAASSATWDTTGMANPNKQKLSVSITPQVVGYIQVRIFIAKASTTLYVDPKIVIS